MSKPTVKAAVEHANRLRLRADIEAARDPYLEPYRPTEAAARKLCSRLGNQAAADLPADATQEQRDAAKATGPKLAIDYMTAQATMRHARHREQNEISERAAARLKRRHEQGRNQRDRDRAHLSPGARIDHAIARLTLIAAPAAAKLGREIGENADKDMTPEFCVDASSKAKAIAYRAMREIEALEDEHRVRDLRAVA